MVTRDYNYSRPLDVHRWSCYTETNTFVNSIYEQHFLTDKANKTIRKKLLKVVLLDLYVAWIDDPNLCIGVHMSPNAYSDGTVFSKGKSRYNELHIKDTIIQVIHRLKDVGLIGFKEGFEGSSEYGGRTSRIWAYERLIEAFETAQFGYFDINYIENKEVIILRDSNKKNVEYETTKQTKEMAKVVRAYNDLLAKTFIDIPDMNKPMLEIKEKNSERTRYVNITHHGKFTHRVFNNSSWDQGGRFYGGFWQQIDGILRSRIYMNDKPTVEIDFSGLHVILAYTRVGEDYWGMTEEDPYNIPIEGIEYPDHARDVIKQLTLLAFNASDESSLFKAFRSEFDYKNYSVRYSFPDEKLSKILQSIKEKHPLIKNLINTGAGLELMNIDSKIAEYVIKDFVKTDTPILTVHDSFIVPFGEEDRLEKLMKEAFVYVTNKNKTKVKFNKNLTLGHVNQAKYSTGPDRDYYLDSMHAVNENVATEGYRKRLERHTRYHLPD